MSRLLFYCFNFERLKFTIVSKHDTQFENVDFSLFSRISFHKLPPSYALQPYSYYDFPNIMLMNNIKQL